MIITEEDYIEHFGKKGMKWGQRKSSHNLAIVGAGALGAAIGHHVTKYAASPVKILMTGGSAAVGAKVASNLLDRHEAKKVSELPKHAKAIPNRRQAKKQAKADEKWQKNIYSVHGAVAVHNRTADRLNNGALDKLNSKYKGKTLKYDEKTGHDMTDKTTRQYIHDYQQLVSHHTAQAIKDVHGTSPSGKHEAKLDTSDKNNWKVKVSPVSMRHGIDGLNSFKDSPKGVSKTSPELLMEVDRTADNKIDSHKRIK